MKGKEGEGIRTDETGSSTWKEGKRVMEKTISVRGARFAALVYTLINFSTLTISTSAALWWHSTCGGMLFSGVKFQNPSCLLLYSSLSSSFPSSLLDLHPLIPSSPPLFLSPPFFLPLPSLFPLFSSFQTTTSFLPWQLQLPCYLPLVIRSSGFKCPSCQCTCAMTNPIYL